MTKITFQKQCFWTLSTQTFNYFKLINQVVPFKQNYCLTECELTIFQVDTSFPYFLQRSKIWDPSKENIFAVHGYAGGDSAPPLHLVENAFITNGQYNLFSLDYGFVSRPPCYIQLVQNIKYVGACLASFLKSFLHSGMERESITCIGHSMGAHICGLIRRNLRMKIKKIIGEHKKWLKWMVKLIRIEFKVSIQHFL